MVKDKIVLITGASSGIGKACAYAFAKAQAKLILCARRLPELENIAVSLRNEYKTAVHCCELDVRDKAAVTRLIGAFPSEWHDVDILVNNAGLAAGLDTVQDGNIADWEDMIDTNVKGLLYVTRSVLPRMITRNTGHIINIGSIAGHHVYPKGAVYCATKYAVNALTQGLRMDLFGKKIRVTTIDPGAVETNFSLVRFKGDTDKAHAVYQGFDALSPQDVADAVVYCASLPRHVNVSEMILMPTDQAAATMIAKK